MLDYLAIKIPYMTQTTCIIPLPFRQNLSDTFNITCPLLSFFQLFSPSFYSASDCSKYGAFFTNALWEWRRSNKAVLIRQPNIFRLWRSAVRWFMPTATSASLIFSSFLFFSFYYQFIYSFLSFFHFVKKKRKKKALIYKHEQTPTCFFRDPLGVIQLLVSKSRRSVRISIHSKSIIVAALSGSKSQISRTILSNLAVVWMVAILPFISDSSGFFPRILKDHSKYTKYNWNHDYPHEP